MKTFEEIGIKTIDDLTLAVTGHVAGMRSSLMDATEGFQSSLAGLMKCDYEIAIRDGKTHEDALTVALKTAEKRLCAKK